MTTRVLDGDARRAAAFAVVTLSVVALFCLPLLPSPEAINADTAWLLTVVDILRAGGRAYVDVVETNPPMSFLLYWPAVWLAERLDLRAETAVFALTTAAAAGSLAMVAHLLRRHGAMPGWGLGLALAALALGLLLIPSVSFSQREHIALILLMPAVASLACRAAGEKPNPAIALTAGFAAGLGAAIKPHLVLVVASPALLTALRTRSPRPLTSPETLASAALVLFYGGVWLARYPEFFGDMLEIAQSTYRLNAHSLARHFTDPKWPLYVYLAVGFAAVLPTRDRFVEALAAAMAGFAFAILEQGKFFVYHIYPFKALALFAAAAALARSPTPSLVGASRMGAAAILCAVSAMTSHDRPTADDVRQAILRLPERRSIVVLSYDIAIAFPLARQIEASWASRLQSTWISNSGLFVLRWGADDSLRERIERAIALEARWIGEDVVRHRPDVIVLDTVTVLDHIRAEPRFAAEIGRNYVLAETVRAGRFRVYRRAAGR